MTKNNRTVVVGVFQDRVHAQQAVNELRRMGFREDQIGVAAREGERVTGATDVGDKGTATAAGAAAGAATGAGLGALWGIGIAAGLLPAIGPAIAGGTLATILSSAAAGAAAVGIAGALVGLGLPEEEARYYEEEFKAGRVIVTVKADGRYSEALAAIRRFGGYDMSSRATTGTTPGTTTAAVCATTPTTAATGTRSTTPASASISSEATRKMQLKEEELRVQKHEAPAGEVQVRKEVHTEHKTIDVPVKKEEVVVERHAVSGCQPAAGPIKAGEEMRIPVREEEVHVEKHPVVKEEVSVKKQAVHGTERVSDTVRKEDVKVEKQGDVNVKRNRK